MRGKLWFGAATAALLMFAPAAIAQEADPPADASTTARFDGAPIEGVLDPAGDSDWYRMAVVQGRRYSFTLDAIPDEAGQAIDPVLIIHDADGAQLAFNDDANGSLNSALSFVPSSSGEVFVAAGSFLDMGAGRYRLAATSMELPPDDAGDDAGTRARVTPGRTASGALDYAGDRDWYRLSVREGQQYRMTLTGAQGVGEALADPFLRVVDESGAEVAVSDDDGGSLNSALTYIPQTSGTVFVIAGAYADAYTGAYALNVVAERAPSDNIAAGVRTRGRIGIGESVDGVLEFERDSDWYRVRLEGGQSYRFTLAASGSNPLGDPLLRLHDANGTEVAMDDDGGGALNSYLEFTAPSTGSYFLNVGAYADASTGGYTLAARPGDVPADASTDVSLSPNGDYREGVLSPAGDRDWYRLELAEGQGVRLAMVTMQGAPDALGDPYLVVYDASGAALASDDDGGDGLNAWLEFIAPTAGAYFVEARGYSPEAEGRYAIALTPGEIPDSIEGAEYIVPGYENRVSTIHAPGDADWFLVEMIEGRPYRFSLTGVGDDALADPVLTLYDANGNVVASDDDGGQGLNAYLTYASATGGSYFAAVSGYGDATGRYELRAVDTDVPGHAYTDEELDSAGDERVSRIDMEGDLDAYRVYLEGGTRYRFEMRGHGASPLADPYLSIINEAGERLASDDDSGPGLDARLDFSAPMSGVYLIEASGLGGAIGWYQVSVSRQ